MNKIEPQHIQINPTYEVVEKQQFIDNRLIQERITPAPQPAKAWDLRLIHQLNQWDEKLDKALPDFIIQKRIDSIGRYIEKKFAPLTKFNHWLNRNGHGEWYQQLATFLVKLPMRSIRNIVQLIYNIIREACYAVVHPLKATNRLAKMLIALVNELTKPETWSKIGAGMIGGSLGQSLVTGQPFSLIGIGIGGGLLIGGLSAGALKAALKAEKGCKFQEVKKNLRQQAQQLPEIALTGFCMGLLVGGIQRAIYEQKMKNFRVSNHEEAKQYADSFIEEYHLPQYSEVELTPSGKIIIKWSNRDMSQFREINPSLFEIGPGVFEFPSKITMDLQPGGSSLRIDFHGWDGVERYRFTEHLALNDLGITGPTYPKPSANTALPELGSIVGTSAAFQRKAIYCSSHP